MTNLGSLLANLLSSESGDGALLVFGRAHPHPAAALVAFVPTAETSELVVIPGPTELEFPLHTQAAAEFFSGPRG